jgi:hypothetical protein
MHGWSCIFSALQPRTKVKPDTTSNFRTIQLFCKIRNFPRMNNPVQPHFHTFYHFLELDFQVSHCQTGIPCRLPILTKFPISTVFLYHWEPTLDSIFPGILPIQNQYNIFLQHFITVLIELFPLCSPSPKKYYPCFASSRRAGLPSSIFLRRKSHFFAKKSRNLRPKWACGPYGVVRTPIFMWKHEKALDNSTFTYFFCELFKSSPYH